VQNNKMLNTLKLHFSQNKSLLIATLISLLLHTLFLSKFALTLPEINEDHQALEMRLVNLPATQKTTPAPIKEKIQKPEPKVNQTNSEETRTTTTHDINPIAEIPQNTPPIKQANAELPAKEVLETSDVAALNNAENKPTPYKYVETEFEVFRGGDASAAGTTRSTFSIDKNGAYQINSTTEAKGLASLFFEPLVQKSEGMVTENGLTPSFFSYEYGNKTQTASFSWNDGILLLHTAKGDKTENLITGTQDLLSFMYQFMFKPPLEAMQITVTNGKNLRTYTYSFEGEETISTKLGELKTIHLLKTGSDVEKTELWLGLDYQYLPVKIRKTEKDGSTIEQTVIKIIIV